MAITQIRIEEILNFKANVIASPLTGYVSGSGTVASTDTLLQAVQKLNGNALLLAAIASPTFTGTPAAPTATGGTNTTQIATTAFVTAAVAAGGGGVSLTTSGSSGVATLVGTVLNVPNYTLSGLGGVPTSTTVAGFALTGNITLANLTSSTGLTGTSYNGSATQSWSIDQSFAPTWTGKHTFNNSVTAVAALGAGIVFTPTLVAGASNDILAAIDINPAYTLGAFTGTQNLGIRMTGAPAAGKVFGVLIRDATHTGVTMLMGSLNDTGGTFSSPGIWVTSTFTNAPSASNYIFSYDAGSAGTIFNSPGTSLPISFRINNVQKMQVLPSGRAILGTTIPTDDTINGLQVLGTVKAGWLLTFPASLSAQNTTATLTVAQLIKGVITSNGAAITLTLPTATALVAALPAVQGSVFDFIIDNSAGSGILTLAINTGITQGSLLTGGTTLTHAAATVGMWRLYFTSTTTAKLARLA